MNVSTRYSHAARLLLQRLTGAVSWRTRAVADKTVRNFTRFRWRIVSLNEKRILQALKSFGPFKSSILLVHSSLSACGYINGGPETVVKALRKWIADRTLVMPTHTYCYPDTLGNIPVFDVSSTPSLAGEITDYFWREPSVTRSIHPSHSLASSGPGSEELCQGHELCDTPCGARTPYERLVKDDCSVLMFGTKAYTLCHTAEDAAQVPYQYEPRPYRLWVKDRAGTLRPVVMWRHDVDFPLRFRGLKTTVGHSQMPLHRWLEERGLLERRRLGLGELLFVPHAGDLHQVLIEELRKDPLFLVPKEVRSDVAKRYAL